MLKDIESRRVSIGQQNADLFLGKGSLALEILIVSLPAKPNKASLRDLLQQRQGRRASPVLIAAPWGNDRVAVCGISEKESIELLDLPRNQVEAICIKALNAEGRNQAIRILQKSLLQLNESILGLRNEGMFAMQELAYGVTARSDWSASVAKSDELCELRGRRLIKGLGYTTEETPGPAVILLAHDRRTALAILLKQPEEIDAASLLFDNSSPISFALAKADRENLDFVLVIAGSTIRLYHTQPGVGTAHRGRSETYVELDLELLSKEHYGYLWLLFSADALEDGGSFLEILERSEDYAADLGVRLRERVYSEVMPKLALGILDSIDVIEVTQDTLNSVYSLSLRVLYRLLFTAYAEDQDLLPLHGSQVYQEHSLKRIAQRLLKAKENGISFSDSDFYWSEVSQIWKAISKGNAEWGVPCYNGTLFASDPATSPLGAKLASISIPDSKLAPALTSLLLDETLEGGEGPVDFRSLGVREFGTIYEGLLESELSLAQVDLKVETIQQTNDVYVPASQGDEVCVRAGEAYLHNKSGSRKSTGSYYTKAFAVEHLLNRALEPAIQDHFNRLDELSDREAGMRFFEFRVADIAMGSGHFLVAALDRIERRMVDYLATRPLPDVKDELSRLRKIALDNLGENWSGEPIEDSQLLRRQIARRCIFGVDLNEMAVELARVSLWIHTFVPGLPLSLMDQNLIQGNSLVGIATFSEASYIIEDRSGGLFTKLTSERLNSLREPLLKLAKLTDANDAEIREARELYTKMQESISSEYSLLDILTASRTNEDLQQALAHGQILVEESEKHGDYPDKLTKVAKEELEGLDVLHFPLAFPHVFLGGRKGFDVIIGNPPWEEATLEEDAFWARYFPGLRSLPQREQEARKAKYRREREDLVELFEKEYEEAESIRKLLVSGAFPGMGTGDPDLYKAFIWRFWHLVSPDKGRIGVVLPRSAMVAKGSADFRESMFKSAEMIDLTMLMNSGRWAFDMEPRYTIGLASVVRNVSASGSEMLLTGPYSSLKSFREGLKQPPISFEVREVMEWNDTYSLPLLPTEDSVEVFAQLRKSPRLDLKDGESWRARPQRELDATNDKHVMDVDSKDCPEGFWPVFKGESFDLWTPDRGKGSYYAWADPEIVIPHLQKKRMRANKRSAFSEFSSKWREDQDTLPCLHPRIAFRDITNRTNQRTIIACLIPPNSFLTNKAPYLVWPRGDEKDMAYLLGVMSSIPFDWYARRFIETSVNFFILNPFPVPRPQRDHPLWQRVVSIAGRLAAQDERFSEWAGSVGVSYGSLDEDTKNELTAELNALVALLYGLTEDHVTHIFTTFHEGWDYSEDLRAALKYYYDWSCAE